MRDTENQLEKSAEPIRSIREKELKVLSSNIRRDIVHFPCLLIMSTMFGAYFMAYLNNDFDSIVKNSAEYGGWNPLDPSISDALIGMGSGFVASGVAGLMSLTNQVKNYASKLSKKVDC